MNSDTREDRKSYAAGMSGLPQLSFKTRMIDRARKLLMPIMISTFILSLVSLFFEQAGDRSPLLGGVIHVVDYVVAILILVELVLDILNAPYKIPWLRRNWPSVSLSVFFLLIFLYNEMLVPFFLTGKSTLIPAFNISGLIALRNFFLVFKVFGRLRRVSIFLNNLTVHPAQTLALSFFMVILVGTFYLMLPMTTVDGNGLHFIDALFTTTSAVCVTGLIVVDTATHFTLAGKIGILVLIQIGGLGIMILSFSAAWALRRKFTLQDKLLLSYMTNQDDLSKVSKSLIGIITLTFGIELVGALWLAIGFLLRGMALGKALWYGIFHSISAFCNAGFALFSDSFESYAADPIINTGLAMLILLGGLSFAVMFDLSGWWKSRERSSLRLNTRIVLNMTIFLTVVGTLGIYGLEFGESMSDMPVGQQYLASFFQAVTLRTAGFNTVPFGAFSSASVMLCLIFMFIGGASGSTAGGVKVNTVAVVIAYMRSKFQGNRRVRIRNFALDRNTASNSLVLFIFAVVATFVGTFLLTVTEHADFTDVVFETVSAFATVGVSRGLTSSLSNPGRIIIVILMFIGRVGPLTILTALSGQGEEDDVYYPETEILIG